MRLRAWLACLAFPALLAGPVTPEGALLAARYDAMDVEHHWLRGHQVDWRTGDPKPDRAGSTHCSEFIAAACERLGAYVLRPPEHGAKFLASAQAEWLGRSGPALGWRPVDSPFKAQELANQGRIVLVLYESPDPRKSGHAALVRPSDKADAVIAEEGPQVTQAGGENAASTSLRQGFRFHRGAWVSAREYKVVFFVHE
jgi:hypothetical protein